MATLPRLMDARGPSRRAVLLGALALIVAEVTGITSLALQRDLPRAVHLAVVADVVLLVAAALWLGGGPRTLGLTAGRALRSVGVGVVLFSLATRAAGVGSGSVLLGVALAAEATVAAVVLAGLVKALRRPGDTWARLRQELRERLPTPVAETAFMEVRLLGAALASLLRRPSRVPTSSATVYVPMAASRSEWFVPFLVIATVVEGGAVHLLLYLLVPGSGWLQGHGVLWLVGDRRLMSQSAHRLEADALELELGLRFAASIPYAQVERVLPLRTDAERRSVQPRRGRRNPQVTPLDAPNVHLCLREPVRYTTLLGLKRSTAHLDLFVERPEEFLAALTGRTGAR
jgi:hypothetical protein